MADQGDPRTEPGPGAAAGPDVAEGARPAEGAEATRDDRVAELEERLLRALADLDNLRKRYDRELGRERAAERARVAGAFLPVVDNLERAIEHAGAECPSVVEGVRAVRDQALGVLATLGFARSDDLGERFDPLRHEAVATTVADAPPGTVVAVTRPGYGSGAAILRPAGVVVAQRSS